VNLELPNLQGETPLMIAVKERSLSLVHQLRLAGASLTTRDHDNNTLLASAVFNGDLECFRYLTEHGASMKDKIGSIGDSLLILACKKSQKEIVELMLADDSVKLNIVNNGGNSALMEASKAGCLDIVKMLLEKKAKATIINRIGSTALSYAVDGEFEEIKTMIRKATLLM
jgi:ankyrin repeat protein